MDTIRYLPDFLIQNLNYVTIMAAFIPLILFTMNIFLIKRKGNDSNLLIVFYVQIMPDDFVMQLHRF
ncbi:hypothetical protein WGA_02670 [Escherichia coli KTE40]|nr:hypothetical protein WGA_02670 [Escherichia coli KTE40]